MKATLFWMLRHLLLPAAFIFATGLPQWVREHPHGLNEDHNPYSFTPEDLATCVITPDNYFDFRDSIIENRKALGKRNAYTPRIYLSDLRQKEMFQTIYYDSLNQDRSGRATAIIMDLNLGFINPLIDITIREQNYHEIQDFDQEFKKQFPNEAIRREKSAAEFEKLNLKLIILQWLLRVYLRGLFPAFILFLMWRFKMKRDFMYEGIKEKAGLTGPLSFLFSLLLWPIVLGIDIRNRLSQSLFRAEVISRRSKMLAAFSRQDEFLFEMGKKMTLVEFREHLDSVGMVRKHSFAAALLATLFLVVVPRFLYPQTTSPIEKDRVVCMKVDYGGGGGSYERNNQTILRDVMVLLDDVCLPSLGLLLVVRIFVNPFLYKSDFVPDIGKVPLVKM